MFVVVVIVILVSVVISIVIVVFVDSPVFVAVVLVTERSFLGIRRRGVGIGVPGGGATAESGGSDESGIAHDGRIAFDGDSSDVVVVAIPVATVIVVISHVERSAPVAKASRRIGRTVGWIGRRRRRRRRRRSMARRSRVDGSRTAEIAPEAVRKALSGVHVGHSDGVSRIPVEIAVSRTGCRSDGSVATRCRRSSRRRRRPPGTARTAAASTGKDARRSASSDKARGTKDGRIALDGHPSHRSLKGAAPSSSRGSRATAAAGHADDADAVVVSAAVSPDGVGGAGGIRARRPAGRRRRR
mmetsp:Transcript_6632/g.13278  ORF Transcript_6632/g.13278 Transcript_6632/m.13278 type:complete len:300 (+) Transcript_6632:353-1252(+)